MMFYFLLVGLPMCSIDRNEIRKTEAVFASSVDEAELVLVQRNEWWFEGRSVSVIQVSELEYTVRTADLELSMVTV